MRERAEIYGGSFVAGPRAGGGFVVCATLPIPDGTHQPSVGSAEVTNSKEAS